MKINVYKIFLPSASLVSKNNKNDYNTLIIIHVLLLKCLSLVSKAPCLRVNVIGKNKQFFLCNSLFFFINRHEMIWITFLPDRFFPKVDWTLKKSGKSGKTSSPDILYLIRRRRKSLPKMILAEKLFRKTG